MINSSKPFKEYDEQIEIMKTRCLIIDDEQMAKNYIMKVNYYTLINGYKKLFLASTKPKERYIANCHFDDIVCFYEYENSLRLNLLNFILTLETNLKTVIGQCFSRNHGACGYTNKSNYRHPHPQDTKAIQRQIEAIEKFKSTIKLAKKGKSFQFDAIRHYLFEKKEDVPIWVMFTNFTISELSYFYGELKDKTKEDIACEFSSIVGHKISAVDFANSLRHLVQIRNACAHNNLLHKFKTKVLFDKDNFYLTTARINKVRYDMTSLDSVILSFKILLNSSDFRLVVLTFRSSQYGVSQFQCSAEVKSRMLRALNCSTAFIDLLADESYRMDLFNSVRP